MSSSVGRRGRICISMAMAAAPAGPMGRRSRAGASRWPIWSKERSKVAPARMRSTYSERGNLQGAQFFAVAGKVYELAKRAGLGREIPTEWFLQDIRN